MYIRITLYVIWALFPLFFFTMALWAKLEQISGVEQKQNPGDFFRQGLFVLGCVLFAMLVDWFALERIVKFLGSSWIPLPFAQFILLPAVFYFGARLVGASKDVMISNAPRPTEVQRQSRRTK